MFSLARWRADGDLGIAARVTAAWAASLAFLALAAQYYAATSAWSALVTLHSALGFVASWLATRPLAWRWRIPALAVFAALLLGDAEFAAWAATVILAIRGPLRSLGADAHTRPSVRTAA